MATINFQLRDRADKNGLIQVRVCIQDKGKRVFTPLTVRVLKSQWDSKAQKVIGHPKADVINNVLKLKMADMQATMATDSLSGSMSLEKIAGRKISKTSFRDFAGACLHKWEKTKAVNSIRAYSSCLKQILRYDKDITVEDITPDWLARYETWCRGECGDGGTLKRVAFVSVILKETIRQGIIERDPFLIYQKPPKKNPPKIWLTLKELTAVEKVARENGSDTIRNTASWFLLACYTGLRYSDILAFDSKQMVQEGRLILYTQKTGEIVSIKLNSKIKGLIRVAEKNGPVYSNQKVNQYLKSVAHLAGINKVITTHTARHTFGVQCANLGISQEVAAKLLGHSDLKTTSIYYKIINTRIDKEMKKWNR